MNSVHGDNFACVHNRDSSDRMNATNFERFILHCKNDDVHISWNIPDKPEVVL